jgi:hypothetical protein
MTNVSGDRLVTKDPLDHQRRWSDLDPGRLNFGILAGQCVPVLALNVLVVILGGHPAAGQNWVSILIMSAAGFLWSLLAGRLYLGMFARRRGLVSRRECVLLLAGITVLMPDVCWFVIFATYVPLFADTQFSVFARMYFPIFAIELIGFGLLLAPLGALGGWIFWRIGVEPARRTEAGR